MSTKSELGGDPGEDCNRRAVPPTSPVVDEAAAARLEILTQDVFSNVLIRKEILKNLEIPDLLRASLVCEGWRIFCREALREDHRAMAVIEGTCSDLKTFSSLLETSDSLLPFNGLSVAIHPGLPHRCLLKDKTEALKVASTIVEALALKRLSIRVDGLSQELDGECGSVRIIRKILKERAEYLEELRFFGTDIQSEDWSFLVLLGILEERFLLPNVRRLELPTSFRSLELKLQREFDRIRPKNYEFAFNRLIAALPKLGEILGGMSAKNLELVLSRGAGQFVREFHLEQNEVPLNTLHRFASLRPTLHALSFSRLGLPKERLMGIMRLILESSKKSLKMLRISEQNLGFILHHWEDVPVFENVKHLRLEWDCFTFFGGRGRSVLSKVECSKYFPNLEQVCIDCMNPREYSELAHTLRSLPGGYACGSVTKIIFTQPKLMGCTIKFSFFKEVFPNTKVCWVRECLQVRSVFVSQLWSAWSGLEEICIFGIIPRSSYDAEFMGIAEEEYLFLTKNIPDFQSLELVPAKRSILDFQKLKKLVLQFDHRDSLNHTVFVSKKVCSWMLSRMPRLTLEVDTFCRLFGPDGYCGEDANVGHLSQCAKFGRHDFRPYF